MTKTKVSQEQLIIDLTEQLHLQKIKNFEFLEELASFIEQGANGALPKEFAGEAATACRKLILEKGYG